MKIILQLSNTDCKIINKLTQDQIRVIQDVCSFRVAGADYKSTNFRIRRKGGFEWDGIKRLFNAQTRRFPIGLLYRVTNLLNDVGIEYKIDDKRDFYSAPKIVATLDNIELRYYQVNAVNMSLIHGNGIIKMATGSGKTNTAAATISYLKTNTVFIVHTLDLLYQTKDVFSRLLPDANIGQIGDGVIEYGDITVATIQTLAILGGIKMPKYTYDEDNHEKYIEKININMNKRELFNKYRNSVECVMFDEVQRICSQTAFSVRFLFNNAYSFFGYSASPWRDDGADLMIEAAMGHKIVDVTATELIENGYLVKPIIDIYPCCNNSSSGTKYGEIYKSAIVENPLRNIQICNLAYDDYSIGKNVLILVTQIKHGEHLESISNNLGMPAIFISGQSRTKKRRNVIEAMRSGDAQIVIATSIADVGLDVPRLDTVVDSGAGKSSVTALQRIGRIMRPFGDKKYCHFITIADNAPYIKDHIEKKIEIWKTESAFEIRDWRKT